VDNHPEEAGQPELVREFSPPVGDDLPDAQQKFYLDDLCHVGSHWWHAVHVCHDTKIMNGGGQVGGGWPGARFCDQSWAKQPRSLHP